MRSSACRMLRVAAMLVFAAAAFGVVTITTDSQTGTGPFTPTYTVSAI